MGWLQIAVFVFQLIFRIWDAVKEKDVEKKKKQTEALQSGIRAVIDRDAGRLNVAISDLNKLR